jgi:hypothetical protein
MKPAINTCNKALALKHDIEKSFLALGKLLHEIKEKRLFEEGFESWGEFLMEMRMSESMSSKLITIYQRFILELQITPKRIAEAGGWTVVYDLVPLAKDKESAEDWLDRAGSMTRSDIKKEAMVARGLPEPKDCEHEWAKCCVKCGMRYDD